MTDTYLKWTIPSACLLGEGPYFSDKQHRLYWVDIKGKALFYCEWGSKSFCRIAVPEQIGWLVPIQNDDWLAGFRNQICRLDSRTFTPSELLTLDEPPHNRLNDAKVDRNGCLYFGTMDDDEQEPSGHFYRWNGRNSPEKIDSGYVVSNGPAFSLDGSVIYTASSSERVVYRMRIAPDGVISNKQLFVRFSADMGFPDGMTVDAQNHLWVAAWRGFGVYRFSPQGELVAKLSLPVPLCTSLTFAGPDHRYLAVTTARATLSPEELERYPQSGDVFILEPKISGVSETPARL